MTGDLISLYQEDPRSQKRDLGHPSCSLLILLKRQSWLFEFGYQA
jgi:hypothetical protein